MEVAVPSGLCVTWMVCTTCRVADPGPWMPLARRAITPSRMSARPSRRSALVPVAATSGVSQNRVLGEQVQVVGHLAVVGEVCEPSERLMDLPGWR